MCGVVGFSGSGAASPEWREAFIRVCTQSRIRGVHAFGIAWIEDGLRHFKSTDFSQVIAAIPDPLPDRIIFHNRYCTSGDYMIAENNQPIIIGGNALVFNGTIDMGTKEEMEARSGYTMLTENDGELVLRDYLEGEPMRRLRSNLATFAGIFLSQDGRMYALRNEMRPLSLIEKDGCKIVCSTRDIALRAKFDENYVSRIEPMKMVRL